MKKTLFALILTTLFSQFVWADAASCESQALSKTGKPLAGAAKTAFMKKCEKNQMQTKENSSCTEKAISKNGKPLTGAAKTAFIKKCEKNTKP